MSRLSACLRPPLSNHSVSGLPCSSAGQWHFQRRFQAVQDCVKTISVEIQRITLNIRLVSLVSNFFKDIEIFFNRGHWCRTCTIPRLSFHCLVQHRNPRPEGKVRGHRLCHVTDYLLQPDLNYLYKSRKGVINE